MDAAVALVLSELDVSFTSKEEQRTALKAFLGGKNVFASLLTAVGKNLVKHRGASQLAAGS